MDAKDWPRLARYISGEARSEELAAIEAWIAADPARRAVVDSLAEAWHGASRGAGTRSAQTDAAWLKLRARMDAADAADAANAANAANAGARRDTRVQTGFAGRRAPGVATALRLAAGLVLIVGIGLLWRSGRLGSAPGAPVSAERTFATRPAERRTIVLDDTSEVVLGVASRLVVAAGYGSPSRELTLEGEALFRVRHDEARPFRVRAAGAVTTDLGTEFAIRAYRGTSGVDTVRVVVTSGSVSVRQEAVAASAAAVVRAGQSAIVAATLAPTLRTEADATRLVAFAQGELTFDDAPLARVAVELERWYDVRVSVASPALGARHLTAAFRGEPLDEVLRVIALSIGASVEHRDREVTFRAASPPK